MESNSSETAPAVLPILRHLHFVYSVVGAIGITGNLFVVFVICRSSRLRGATHLFILNQSLVDLASSLLFLLLKFGKRAPPLGVLGDMFCKFWYSDFFMWSLFLTSTTNLSAVTIERYAAICNPIFHRGWVTKKKIRNIIIAEWFVGMPIEFLWGLPFSLVDGACIRTTSFIYGVLTGCLFFLFAWFLPLTLMAYCYIRMWMVLRHNTVMPTTGDNMAARGNYLRRAQKNVVKTLLIVGVVYAVCWGPNQLSLLYFNLGGYIDFLGYLHNISILMVFCNMCVNPFIYAFQYEQFRQSIPHAFGFKRQTAIEEQATDTTTGGSTELRIV